MNRRHVPPIALERLRLRLGCLTALAMLALAAPTSAQTLEDQIDAIAREVAGTEQAPAGQADGGVLEQTLLAADESLRTFDVDQLETHANVPKRIGGGKVGGRLLHLAQNRSKSLSALREQAENMGVAFDDGLASVRLFADDERDVASLRSEVARHGGEVEATFENVVLARLPVESIETLAAADTLYFMGASPTYQPSTSVGYGNRVSEGVRLSKVDALQRAGITGKGVKVGILDFGFQRYGALVRAGEVPRAAGQRAFNRSRRVEADTVHGTGCAEIVADMAPAAALYLAAVNGREGQIVAAGRWLASQGVDIINFSGGGHFDPHNGSALLDRFVDYVVREHNVLWVNAAGNEGATHWTGMAVDRNRNGLVDSIDRRLPDFIALRGGSSVLAVWDDWGSDPRRPSSRQDIDAWLVVQRGRRIVPVAASRQVQNGRGVPAEYIKVPNVPSGETLYLALQLKRVRRPVRIHVIVSGGGAQMHPKVPEGSVGIPATARGALAVGAVDARTDRIEDYSSRGPTDDRRMKPEVSGPDKTISMAYGRGRSPDRFPGTSAAAPHVAGFAALLKEMEPGASAADLYAAVKKHVTPKGRGTPNTEYGHGRIDASRVQRDRRSTDEAPSDPADEAPGEADDDFERRLREIVGETD